LTVPIVVSDTSPIRALVHLELMDLLPALYSEVLIPPAVARELENPASGMGIVDVLAYPFLQIRGPSDRAEVGRFLRMLDPGESEALALALEVSATVILIDEAKGRDVARRIGLVPVGVLGTLVRAKRRGLIGAIEPLIDRLQDELRFFVSSKLRADVLRDAGELP
jgi:uncharacterized protein